MRFEVPALVVVDAEDQEDAIEKARAIGPRIERTESFGDAVTLAVIGVAVESEDRDEKITDHAESLQMAAGFPW